MTNITDKQLSTIKQIVPKLDSREASLVISVLMYLKPKPKVQESATW